MTIGFFSLLLACGSSLQLHRCSPTQVRWHAIRSVRVAASAVEPSLGACASDLESCGGAVVAAAAALGEAQCQEDDPGALSAGGCALSIAGKQVALAAEHLGVGSWEAATEPLSEASQQLAEAGASLEFIVGDGMLRAAAELEDGASCTGCISLAAAAAPNLQAGGEGLVEAADRLRAHGDAMIEQGTLPAHAHAGAQLVEAGLALGRAGSALQETGEALDDGRLVRATG